MQKVSDNLLKVLIACALALSPLFFFTDFSRNPFQVQTFILVCSSMAALFLSVLKLYREKEPCFYFSKVDIALLIFFALAMVSLGVNLFTSVQKMALLNEFWRRGHTIVTCLSCGYFLMRLICNKNFAAEEETEEKDNYKTGFLFLLWGLLWLPFGYIRTNGIFDIYGIAVWLCGIWIVLRFLKEITAKNILDIILAVGALASAYGICQNLGYDFIWSNGALLQSFGSRSISTFGNPNFLSSYILFAFPLGFIYFLNAKTKASKIYYFLVCLFYIAFLAISQTRSSWLGLLCAGAVMLCSKTFRDFIFDKKKYFVLLLVCAGAIFVFWPAQQQDGQYKSIVLQRLEKESTLKPNKFTLAVAKEDINQSYHQRLLMWTSGLKNIKAKPLFGWGWGSWQLTFGPMQGKLLNKYPALKELKTQANAAHNVIIEIITQSGFIGLISYLIMLGILFIIFINYCKKETKISKKLFYLAVFSSCVGFFADNLLNMTFTIPVICFVFYLYVGILASLEVKKFALEKSKLRLFLILVTLLASMLIVKNFNILLSSYYYFSGVKVGLAGNMDKTEELFEKGYNLSPVFPDDSFNYIKILLKQQKKERLNEVVTEVINYYPYYYEFQYIGAAMEADKGNLEGSLAYLKKALELYPFHTRSLDLILALLDQNPSLRTMENAHYIENIPLSLSYQNAYNILLAQIYLEHGNYEKARSLLLKELNKNIYDGKAQEKLAEVNEKLGIKKEPVLEKAKVLTALRKEISQAEEIKPNLLAKVKETANNGGLEEKMLLAQVYFKQQDYPKCREILEELYKTNSDFLPLNFALSSLEATLGNKKEAQKYLFNILSYDDENQLALQRLDNLN